MTTKGWSVAVVDMYKSDRKSFLRKLVNCYLKYKTNKKEKKGYLEVLTVLLTNQKCLERNQTLQRPFDTSAGKAR